VECVTGHRDCLDQTRTFRENALFVRSGLKPVQRIELWILEPALDAGDGEGVLAGDVVKPVVAT
jgi:hypothetical protein